MEEIGIEHAILVGGRQTCLLDETRGYCVAVAVAEDAGEAEQLLRARKGDIGQAALFGETGEIDRTVVLDHRIRALMRENPLGQANDEDHRTLQPLGFVDGQQADTIALIFAVILSLLFKLGHAGEKLADAMITARDPLQLLQFVETALQFTLFLGLKSLGVIIGVLAMFAIDVAQVLIVGQRAQHANGQGWLVMTALLHTLDQRHKVFDARLILERDRVGLLIAEMEERAPAGIRGQGSVERGCQAVRGLASAHKVVFGRDIGYGAKSCVLFAAEYGRKHLVPFARNRSPALALILLVDALAVHQSVYAQ